MQNPYKNPLEGKSGYTQKLLESLTAEELREYIAWCKWSQDHESFPDKPKNIYQSRAYFLYRTTRFVYDAKKEIDRRDEMATESGEVTENDEESEAT